MLVSGLPSAFAKDPASAEQLRSEVESALKAKDTNAFMAHFYWQGMSDKMKSEMNDENADVFSHDIAAVKCRRCPLIFNQQTSLMEFVTNPTSPSLA